MAQHSCPESGAPPIPDELDLPLLHGVQACLRCLKDGVTLSDDEVQAFRRFYAQYNLLFEHVAAASSLRGMDREDCLQEAWQEIIRSLPDFTSDGMQSKLCAWLQAVVHSKAVNIHRRNSRHPTKALSAHLEASLPCRQADPVAEYEQHCREEMVRRALELLRAEVSDLNYCVFFKHWIEEKTVQEIASEMNLTPHRVSCRLQKANEKFRKIYEHLDRWRGG